jgi:hypothetical protein
MPKLSTSVIEAATGIDPLNLAILLIGVVALAAVWLAAVTIKSAMKRK